MSSLPAKLRSSVCRPRLAAATLSRVRHGKPRPTELVRRNPDVISERFSGLHAVAFLLANLAAGGALAVIGGVNLAFWLGHGADFLDSIGQSGQFPSGLE